ncbi:MAG: hypothetical protein MJA27_01975 [Pseudanabaenales cyanobacterium]|nr:hypothetical protein [Pseudanabaenales cyanobacterium]
MISSADNPNRDIVVETLRCNVSTCYLHMRCVVCGKITVWFRRFPMAIRPEVALAVDTAANESYPDGQYVDDG